MLSIYLGDMKEAVYHPPTYFDNMYEDEWSMNSLSVEMILDVSVERIQAFTPLPRPSASTKTMELSFCSTISIWSPQSCSPFLFTLQKPISVQRLFIGK